MIELKSLLLGLILTLGIFAVKTGAGLGYVLRHQTTALRKLAALSLCFAAYSALFLGSYRVCMRLDMIASFNKLRTLFQSGMTLHIAVAMGMFVWGVFLLRHNHGDSSTGTWGWLLLVVPCPVCGSVVLFSTGFLASFFPDNSFSAVLGAYAIFSVIVLFTVGALSIVSVKTGASPERALGFSMLFIAAYFVISVLLAPHINDLDKIYRIAAFQESNGTVDRNGLGVLAVVAVSAFGAGFLGRWRKERIF